MQALRDYQWLVGVACLLWITPAAGQRLIERVVARVGGYAITLTDVRAAIVLGLVEAPAGPTQVVVATEGLIDRQVVLAEVARFPPPEPDAAAIAREAAALIARAGPDLAAVTVSTGLDQGRIQDIARDNLRIEAYLDQRFGTAVQLTEEEVTQYYRIHPEEFTRDGVLSPFVEVEALVRERASAERRAAILAEWVRDLRVRAVISKPKELVD